MAGVKEKAGRYKRLQNDDTFQEVIEGVRMLQMAIFMNPSSNVDERDEAHEIIRALSKLDDFIQAAIADETIFDKKGR